MKWFSLFAAAFVISATTAHADPRVPVSAVQSNSAYPPGYVMTAGADNDYPAYPAGFSSYRGLGFMGSCCEQVSPCAQHAWDGYCDQKGCCETKCGPTFCEKLHAWLYRPEWSCYPNSCNPCGGPGANWWPAAPSCGEPLCYKLQRLRGILHSGACCDPCCEDSKGFEPAKGETQNSVEPLPEPAAPQAPAPRTTSGSVPNLPSPPSPDRSASRTDLWRLPSVGGSY